jgi:hypothetical protein
MLLERIAVAAQALTARSVSAEDEEVHSEASTFQSAAARCNLSKPDVNSKVAGSIPASPLRGQCRNGAVLSSGGPLSIVCP